MSTSILTKCLILNIAPILRLTFFYIFDYGGPQVSHANKKITTQTKVTAQKQKLMARKQKLTARKQKLTAQKKNSRHQRKNSRHQRKTHGTRAHFQHERTGN
jgi:hypothetical protein